MPAVKNDSASFVFTKIIIKMCASFSYLATKNILTNNTNHPNQHHYLKDLSRFRKTIMNVYINNLNHPKARPFYSLWFQEKFIVPRGIISVCKFSGWCNAQVAWMGIMMKQKLLADGNLKQTIRMCGFENKRTWSFCIQTTKSSI